MNDWRQALTAYEELGDAEAVGRVCYDMTDQLLWAARNEEATETARRGLSTLEEQVSADRCRLLAVAGANLSLGGDYANADSMIGQAVTLAEEFGAQRLLGQALTYKTAHHIYYMQLREAVEVGLQAVELLHSAGDLWDLANVLWYPQIALFVCFLLSIEVAFALDTPFAPPRPAIFTI